MLAHRGRLRHGRHRALGEVRGIGRREPHAPHACDTPHRAQQVGKVVRAVVVAVDRLAKERHLGGAARGEVRHLAHHVLQLAAPLRPPRHRNDAEGAPIIAAPLHRHEGRDLSPPHRRHVLVVLPALELDLGGPLPRTRPRDQLGQPAVAVWADHQVHLRNPLQQPRAQPLRHAAHHPQHTARSLETLQLAHARQYLLLRMVADGTRVHQHHVGLGGIVGAHEALAPQHAEHQLGVRDVHLAAVSLDVDARHGQRTVTSKRGRPFHSWVGR